MNDIINILAKNDFTNFKQLSPELQDIIMTIKNDNDDIINNVIQYLQRELTDVFQMVAPYTPTSTKASLLTVNRPISERLLTPSVMFTGPYAHMTETEKNRYIEKILIWNNIEKIIEFVKYNPQFNYNMLIEDPLAMNLTQSYDKNNIIISLLARGMYDLVEQIIKHQGVYNYINNANLHKLVGLSLMEGIYEYIMENGTIKNMQQPDLTLLNFLESLGLIDRNLYFDFAHFDTNSGSPYAYGSANINDIIARYVSPR